MILSIFVMLVLLIDCSLYALIINEAGTFVLGQNITDAATVVSITTSNVILDLNGHTISNGTIGIEVSSGLSNITIKNGIIDGSSVGISVQSSVSSLTIQSVKCINCDNRAIELVGSSGNEIEGCILNDLVIQDCVTSTVSGDNAIQLVYVNNITMNNIVIQTSGNASITFKGINLQNCSTGVIQHIIIQNNTGSSLDGVYVDNTQGLMFLSLQVRDNSAAGNVRGFVFTGSGTSTNGNVSLNCYVANNVSTTTGSVSGYEILVNVIYCTWIGCIANNNVAQGAVATANCYGFNLDQPTYCSFSACRAISNRATGDGTTNIAAGFNISTSGVGTTGTKNCEFSYNVASLNNGFSDALSYGIRAVSDTGGNTSNVYIQNIAIRNGPTTPTAGNQITSTGGAGASPGGVPSGSLIDVTISTLGTFVVYGNVRIT